jgi:ADP-ribosylglycohydrolase
MSLSAGPTIAPPEPTRAVGCLLGGAVGDALGAPVEFATLSAIRARYGPEGIQGFVPAYGVLGAITDDTQMTLFTAEGLLQALRRGRERGIWDPPTMVYHAYLRWLETQGGTPPYPYREAREGALLALPSLHASRAPGNTCLSALRSGRMGSPEAPLNDSKGCGGVMRAAPAGLVGIEDPFTLGCEVAAITHGHPSGYLAAGFLAAMIAALAAGATLREALGPARNTLIRWPGQQECLAAVDQAVRLAREAPATPETVERLGAGWVAEEALAIALFAALATGDLERGVVLAVNHGGDSDSTGAIAGNLLGALLGPDAIPARWLERLELRDEVASLACALATEAIAA